MATKTKHIESKKYGKTLTLKDRITIEDINKKKTTIKG